MLSVVCGRDISSRDRRLPVSYTKRREICFLAAYFFRARQWEVCIGQYGRIGDNACLRDKMGGLIY